MSGAPPKVKFARPRLSDSVAPSSLRPVTEKAKLPIRRCAMRSCFRNASVAFVGFVSVPSMNSNRPTVSWFVVLPPKPVHRTHAFDGKIDAAARLLSLAAK